MPVLASVVFAVTGIAGIALATVLPDAGAEKIALVFEPGTPAQNALEAVLHTRSQIIKFGTHENVVHITTNHQSSQYLVGKTGAWFAMDASGSSSCFRKE